jgi:hypothetical protein
MSQVRPPTLRRPTPRAREHTTREHDHEWMRVLSGSCGSATGQSSISLPDEITKRCRDLPRWPRERPAKARESPQCDVCGRRYAYVRPTSRYCGSTCRAKASRQGGVNSSGHPEQPIPDDDPLIVATRREREAAPSGGGVSDRVWLIKSDAEQNRRTDPEETQS